MRTVFLLKERRFTAAAGILLIVTLFLAGAWACDGAGVRTYQLAISSGSGGSVTTPGAGTFAYDAGMVVQLAAAADDGYHFGSWTGDIANVADPNAASTTITMNGDYAIVANFEIESGTEPDGGGGGSPS